MADEGKPFADSEESPATPEQHVAMAWLLEEGARRFYQQVCDEAGRDPRRELFAELARDEAGHKQTLLELYEGLTKQRPPRDFPAGVLPEGSAEDCMEGGFRVAAALESVRRGDLAAACDLAVTVEKAALDRYLHLQRTLADENSRRVFEVLIIEERRHLQKLNEGLRSLQGSDLEES